MAKRPVIKAPWIGNIARFRKGRTALMQVNSIDSLCGYPVAYGIDIGGSYFHTAVSNLVKATPEDVNTWNSYRFSREAALKPSEVWWEKITFAP